MFVSQGLINQIQNGVLTAEGQTW